MVHNVVRSETEAINSRCWVKHAWNSSSEVHIFSYAFHSCCVMKVAWTNARSYHVPVCSRTFDFNLETLTNIDQLCSDFSNLLQRFCMQKVARAPIRIVVVGLPLLENMQKSKMVGLRYEKLLSCLVTFFLPVFGSEEDRRHTQHGNNGQQLISAAKLFRDYNHLTQRRIKRKLDHFSSKLSQVTCIIKSTQYPKLIHWIENVVLWWWIHEIELKQVFHIQWLQQKHNIIEIGPLDFRDVVFKEFTSENSIGIQPIALSRTCSSCSSSPLIWICLRNRCDLQSIHTDFRIIHLQFAKASIYNKFDSIQSKRCFSYIRGNNTLSMFTCFKDFGLYFRSKLRIYWQDNQWNFRFWFFKSVGDKKTCCFNVFLACHENEDVTWIWREMDFQCLLDSSFDVILWSMFWKELLNWKSSPWDVEDWHSTKKFRELLWIHCCWSNDQFEVSSPGGYLLEDSK